MVLDIHKRDKNTEEQQCCAVRMLLLRCPWAFPVPPRLVPSRASVIRLSDVDLLEIVIEFS